MNPPSRLDLPPKNATPAMPPSYRALGDRHLGISVARGKTTGKPRENGKTMEKTRENHGKTMGKPGGIMSNT